MMLQAFTQMLAAQQAQTVEIVSGLQRQFQEPKKDARELRGPSCTKESNTSMRKGRPCFAHTERHGPWER